MSGEYISREAVMQMFADHVKRSNNSDFAPTPTWNQAVQIVEDFPAADVVEVVRCGECIRKDICRTSNVWAVSPDDNWFCADGKRKEGGQDEEVK